MVYNTEIKWLEQFSCLDKFKDIENNQYFIQELDLLIASSKVSQYYREIIEHIEIDRKNPNNSYIMWLCNKVDQLDFTKPANIKIGHVSMPDVDMDFEIRFRDKIIDYVRNKYGKDCVSQMVTFGRMQGCSALKDVLRVHSACSFEEMNRITANIPDEAAIADKLQEMREADKATGGDGEASIIRWALENHPEEFQEWVHIDKEDRLQGPLAKLFEQAIRLEGTKRSQGKHAAGIAIGSMPLNQICPMVYDKSANELIAGIEYTDLEQLGVIKLDCLGVAALDKLHIIQDLVNQRRLRSNQ